MMKIKTNRTVIVQCRLSSTRLPGKALKDLGGKPVLAWVLSSMKKVNADHYFVATDEASYEALLPVCREYGFECFAGSLNDVLDRFVSLLNTVKTQTVIRATADNPFLFYEAAEESAALFEEKNEGKGHCDYLTYSGLPHGSGVEVFSADSLKKAAGETSDPYDHEHVGPAFYNHKERYVCEFVPAPRRYNFPELRTTIDTYSDYLRAVSIVNYMNSKGYEIKDAEISPEAHKYIGFRAPGQERWIRGRAKSLGEDFTKERIRERIEEKARIRAERMKRLTKRNPSMIDTSQDKFAESPGLMRWAEKQNLKAAAQIQSKLAEMGLDSFDALDAKIESLHKQAKEGKKATIALDKDITRFEDLLHYAHVYNENKKYIRGYEKSKDKERYYRAHGYDIEIANGAIDRLKNAGLDPDRIDLQKMESDYAVMTADREKTSSAYKAAEKECEKLKKLRDDLTSYVGTEQSLDIERDVKRTL